MEAKEFWEKLSQTLDLPFEIEDVTNIEENAGSVWIDTKKGTFSIMMPESESTKKFFWKDMSGRGYSSQITLKELLEMEDRNMSDLDRDEDDDEETLSEWAKEAEEGDTFTRNADHYTCIES